MPKQLELFTSNYALTDIGLKISGQPDYEDWREYGRNLNQLDGMAGPFAIGDWIASFDFEPYDREKWQIIQDTFPDKSYGTLQEYEQVSLNVELSIRIDNLGWKHHQVIKSESRSDKIYWLNQALNNGWSASKLREELLESKKWRDDQLERREIVEQGGAVTANKKTDTVLILWAQSQGRYVAIDRGTIWGNPFLFPADGNRQTVIDNYEWYYRHKPSLHNQEESLKGKVLGCWCYPEPCHGDILIEYSNDEIPDE